MIWAAFSQIVSDVPPVPIILKATMSTKETMSTKSSRPNIGYNRVAIRKPTPAVESKPLLAFPVSIKDKFMCFMTGENEDTRLARLRLNAYLKLLQSEYLHLEVSRSQHFEGGKRLCAEFEIQKLQLHKWGLTNILPSFHMQVNQIETLSLQTIYSC